LIYPPKDLKGRRKAAFLLPGDGSPPPIGVLIAVHGGVI
jgi:hypothetical protein